MFFFKWFLSDYVQLKNIRKFSFVRAGSEDRYSLKGNIISYAFVYINNDSVSCMDGDVLCNGSYKSIDSIRVGFENYGISSRWNRVKSFDGVIQIIIQTNRDLRNYIVFNNVKYQVYKNNLKKLKGWKILSLASKHSST